MSNFEEVFRAAFESVEEQKLVDSCREVAKLTRMFYDGFIEAGFTETESMELTLGVITTIISGGGE